MFKIKTKDISEFNIVDPNLRIGFAQVVTNETGQPLKPNNFNKNGQPQFSPRKGIHIIQVFRFEQEITIKVFKIVDVKTPIATLEQIEPNFTLFNNAIRAGIDKSYCYGCKAGHYCL